MTMRCNDRELLKKEQLKVLNVMAESERHHMRACFGPSDQLVLVLPNKPSNGQPATVEIHDAQRLEEQNEFECRSLFAGPLVRLDAPNYKLFYQCKKWMTGTQNIVEEDRDSFELIGNFLEHHIKQNGVMVRKNLIDLILKGHETTTTIQPNSDEEESDDRVNKIFAQGLEEIDQPFRVDRSIMSLKEVADHFRHLLMYGWKKDALDWAVKSKLWGHAFLLAHFMGRQAQAYVIGRFDSSDFEENDASQRFYEILNASPPATDEMEQDRLITWRPHLAMILSNQAENSDRDRTFIRTMADALEFDGKVHASNFCYLMTEMCYGSSDNYKICLSASRNSIVLKLIDSVKNVVHIYSLVLDCQESIPTRHQVGAARVEIEKSLNNFFK
ncbi:protein transport protein Sec16A-like [Mercenaria mercenaria]|uniref:protein transport protein Sec16A-like n=1 Tax=Mercenaria mercenaria TaxID=6596 RepID=UPI00234F8730|nr:protein transport protein Sec16A-like [Mercenaria mercenaria]